MKALANTRELAAKRLQQLRKMGIDHHQSQFGQDALIGDVIFRGSPGFFVDVGARDGKVISNTYYLERIGWSGIAIEPHPELFERLKRTRQCKSVNVAASDSRGMVEFVKFVEEPLGHSGILGTFRDLEELDHKSHEVIPVPSLPLAEILDGAPDIDYLDIDVEGHELEVLKGMDFERHNVGVIGVEAHQEDAKNIRLIDDFLSRFNYHPFLQVGVDRFFSRSGSLVNAQQN